MEEDKKLAKLQKENLKEIKGAYDMCTHNCFSRICVKCDEEGQLHFNFVSYGKNCPTAQVLKNYYMATFVVEPCDPYFGFREFVYWKIPKEYRKWLPAEDCIKQMYAEDIAEEKKRKKEKEEKKAEAKINYLFGE